MTRSRCAVIVLVLLLGGCRTVSESDPPLGGSPGPLLVLAAPDADVWVQLLRSSGASARVGTLAEIMDRPAGVITPAARLVDRQAGAVRRWVAAGGMVVVAHEGLVRSLGFSRSGPVLVDRAVMAGDVATWPAPTQVWPLQGTRRLSDFHALASSGEAVLVATARLGRGGVLAVAVDPIGAGQAGYERFPSFGRAAASWTRAAPGPTRAGVEVYLDPARVTGSVEEIAGLLSGAGAVHVAGWYLDPLDPSLDYPYLQLIDALHAQGVLAYAWLDAPAATPRLWEDHPECRERTASGRDAETGGRKLFALEDPACFELAWSMSERVVTSFPWDGVNLTGLAFDGTEGLDDYTPFHPSAIERFGSDPLREPQAFGNFRTDLAVELNEAVLRRLNGVPRAPEMGFELTTTVREWDPPGDRRAGVDLARLARVATEQGAALQVTEASTVLEDGPERFNLTAPRLAALMPPGQAFVDLDGRARRDSAANEQMTGGELDLTVMSAAQISGRVALHTAGTVPRDDLDHLPAALAGGAEVFDSGVRSRNTVTMSAPGGAGYGRLLVDGERWPAAAGWAVIPPGEHRLTWSKGAPDGPSLMRITGELGTASVNGDAMTFSYDSRPPALAVVEPQPREVFVDDVAIPATVVTRPSGGFVVSLPSGTHRIEMRFGTER